MGVFQPRDIETDDPSELRKQLNLIQKKIFQDIALLERRPLVSAVQTGATYGARYGEIVRVSPPTTGLRVILPPPGLALANARVAVIVEGTAGPLTLEAVDSTINGATTLTYGAALGVVELVLSPDGWWAFSGALSAPLTLLDGALPVAGAGAVTSVDMRDGASTEAVVTSPAGGQVEIAINYVGTTSNIDLSVTGAQGVIDISALQCGGLVSFSATGPFSVDGWSAKPDGFWFDVLHRNNSAFQLGTLNHATGASATSMRLAGLAAKTFDIGDMFRLRYYSSRWRCTLL